MRLDDGPLEPAEFRVVPDADGMGNERRVEVCCPRCGKTQQMDIAIHTVHRSGAVTPIFVCDSESCPYSEWLSLIEQLE